MVLPFSSTDYEENKLENLADVNTSSLSNDEILKYNSSTQEWENTSNVLAKLSDVNFTGLSIDDQIKYDGTNFVNFTPVAGAATTLNISVEGVVSKKRQIAYDTSKSITSSDIVARLDNAPDKEQVFTFGEKITSRLVGVGNSTTTIAYSDDNGLTWTSLGNSIFTSAGNGVAFNGSMWVAVGEGTNAIAYSTDGISWTGLGTSIFTNAYGVAWGDGKFVAAGTGPNTSAYSTDGINWTGTSVFPITGTGRSVKWNGSIWLFAGDTNTHALAYSTDAINWTGTGSGLFAPRADDIAWNGTRWVAVGQATGGPGNAIAYSDDNALTWTGLGASVITTRARTILWNGKLFVAGGQGGNTLAYSYDGITWTGLGTSVMGTNVSSLAWNGARWIAGGGNAPNNLAYSSDGIHWTGLGTSGGGGPSPFPAFTNGLAFNTKRPNTITFDAGSTADGSVSISGGTLTLSSTTLDVVADEYNNNGYTNFTIKIS